jgi:hypothetical protein
VIIEIIDRIGGTPLRIDAAQLIIRNDVGTPVCVAGEYGPAGNIKVAHAGDRDFDQSLRAFGYRGDRVKVETINPSKPPDGARLLTNR